ncbi:MAG: EamA family transporter, partial [Desulfuromonas sp.]
RLTPKQFGAVLLLGMTGVLGYNVAFFFGLQTVEASRAGLIIALNPVGITLLSALIGGEPLTPTRSLGVLISMIGAMLVISRGDIALLTTGIGSGELALFGCVLCWSLYSVIGRRAMLDLTPLTAVTYSATAGTLLLLPLALSHNLLQDLGSYNPAAFASVFYLAIFGTVLGFLWYYQAIRTIGTVRSGVFINFVPLFAVLFGVILLGENLSSSLIQGAILVTTGVWFTNHGTWSKQQ